MSDQEAVTPPKPGQLVFAGPRRSKPPRHLADLSPQMLFKLNAILGNGTVRRIEFVVDEKCVIATRERPSKDTADEEFISLAERETTGDVMRSARQIEDDDLRNAFLLAAGRCLARRELHYKAEGKQ